MSSSSPAADSAAHPHWKKLLLHRLQHLVHAAQFGGLCLFTTRAILARYSSYEYMAAYRLLASAATPTAAAATTTTAAAATTATAPSSSTFTSLVDGYHSLCFKVSHALLAVPFKLGAFLSSASHNPLVALGSRLVDTAVALFKQNLPTIAQTFQSSARLTGFATLLSASSLLWLVSVKLKDVSIVDPFWSLGFWLLAAIYKHHPDTAAGFIGRKQLITTLVSVWAVRLSAYLLYRNHGIGEDFRYRAFRKYWGEKYWWVSLLQTFWLQSILCFLISQPLLVAQKAELAVFTDKDVIGTAMWVAGFLFEAVGDFQLARFKSNPANKGELLTRGLWKYTRHPNYFGNALMFWGLYVIACNAKNGWRTLPSPLLMTWLLTSLSGVPLLEKSLHKTKPKFASYVQNTSSFLPWFPAL